MLIVLENVPSFLCLERDFSSITILLTTVELMNDCLKALQIIQNKGVDLWSNRCCVHTWQNGVK